MQRSDHATAKLHRQWLQDLTRFTGKSLTRIADDIGLARSTLTRPVKDGDAGTSTLHANTINKIVENTGFPPPGSDLGQLAQTMRGGVREDAVPYRPEPGNSVAAAVAALAGAQPGVFPWVVRSSALELIGYLPGDIVLIDLNATPRPGDAVCAQIYEWSRMKAETVLRVLERAAPVDLLLSRSRDPAQHQPIVVDGERVVIKGVILPHRLRASAA